MFGRLLNTITSTFYKTKWTYHLPRKHPNKPLPVPFKHWKIYTGDIVKIRTGDDRGKISKVVKVLRKINRVVVKNINMNEYTKSKPIKMQNFKTARTFESKNRPPFMFQMLDSTIKSPGKQFE